MTNMKATIFRMAPVALLGTSLLLTGCHTSAPVPPSPGKLELSVTRNPVIQNTDLTVDVIGVNDSEKERIFGAPLANYFPDSPLRDDFLKQRRLGVSFYFPAGAGAVNPQILSSTNALWKTWQQQGVTHIVVVCDLRPLDAPGRKASVSFDWNKLGDLAKDKTSGKRRVAFEVFQDSIQTPPGLTQ
jgi:hypothetical protein